MNQLWSERCTNTQEFSGESVTGGTGTERLDPCENSYLPTSSLKPRLLGTEDPLSPSPRVNMLVEMPCGLFACDEYHAIFISRSFGMQGVHSAPKGGRAGIPLSAPKAARTIQPLPLSHTDPQDTAQKMKQEQDEQTINSCLVDPFPVFTTQHVIRCTRHLHMHCMHDTHKRAADTTSRAHACASTQCPNLIDSISKQLNSLPLLAVLHDHGNSAEGQGDECRCPDPYPQSPALHLLLPFTHRRYFPCRQHDARALNLIATSASSSQAACSPLLCTSPLLLDLLLSI